MSNTVLVAVSIGVGVVLVVFLILLLLAPRIVRRYGVTGKDGLEQTNATRVMLTTAFGVLGLVIGGAGTVLTLAQSSNAIGFTGQAVKQTDQTIQLSREGQITDRYSAAVNELASNSFDARVGGIYALQRVMKESPPDQPAVAQVLAAFVQRHSHRRTWSGAPPADIYNAARVLAYRDPSRDVYRLDLDGSHLEYVELLGAHFPRADLSGVQFDGATLDRTDFQGSDVGSADFSGGYARSAIFSHIHATDTIFSGTKLKGAQFQNATLTRTDFSSRDTELSLVDFTGARMKQVDFSDADLRNVRGLTQRQIDSSITNRRTLCPQDLKCPRQ